MTLFLPSPFGFRRVIGFRWPPASKVENKTPTHVCRLAGSRDRCKGVSMFMCFCWVFAGPCKALARFPRGHVRLVDCTSRVWVSHEILRTSLKPAAGTPIDGLHHGVAHNRTMGAGEGASTFLAKKVVDHHKDLPVHPIQRCPDDITIRPKIITCLTHIVSELFLSKVGLPEWVQELFKITCPHSTSIEIHFPHRISVIGVLVGPEITSWIGHRISSGMSGLPEWSGQIISTWLTWGTPKQVIR